jgi:HK97 family phage major capsid protein
MQTKQLFEKKAALVNEIRDLDHRLKSEKRQEMNADELSRFDSVHDDLRGIERQIEAIERLNNVTAQQDQLIKPQNEEKRSYKDVFVDYCKGRKLSLDDKGILERGTTTITTTTAGTNYGGYAVAEEFSGELNRQMALYGGMLSAARIINSTTGGTLSWPKVNDTSAKATIIGEGSATTVQDFTLTRIQLGAYTYRDLIKISQEWAQDEGVNMVGELSSMIAERFGRALNEHFTTGDGSSKPTGFVTDAATGHTGAATAITADDLIDLEHSVDPAYRSSASAAFMLNDSTLAAVRKLTVGTSDDRLLWQPGYVEGAPDRILGYRYVVNQDMADIGASAKSIAFGDWSKYIIRRVANMNLRRLDERFADELEIGFLAWARYDGKLLDAAALKVLTHAAS